MSVYEPRTYRGRVAAAGLTSFRIVVGETDLAIQAETDLTQVALSATRRARRAIEDEIAARPRFFSSLVPLESRSGAPRLVLSMYESAQRAGTGPMAAVAGAVSQFVGTELLKHSPQVIVENGGDLFVATTHKRKVAVYAGRSPLSDKIALSLPAGSRLGVCTSSGTVGHSYSTGKADAAVVIARDAAFADAMATALGNRVKSAEDIGAAVEWAGEVEGVLGVMVVLGAAMGVWGQFPVCGV